MQYKDKLVFVNDLMAALTCVIKDVVKKMPEEWDGVELQEYIALKVAEGARMSGTMDRARAKRFKNEIVVRNL